MSCSITEDRSELPVFSEKPALNMNSGTTLDGVEDGKKAFIFVVMGICVSPLLLIGMLIPAPPPQYRFLLNRFPISTSIGKAPVEPFSNGKS